jgi:hypothetical protein
MAERTRRYPKRPAVFWAVFALVAALGVGATAELGLKAGERPAILRP